MARELVIRIRENLEPFEYDPEPKFDGVSRTAKIARMLENGAEYQGEWDDEGHKHGKGI